MNIKVIFSSGGKFNNNSQQRFTDNETTLSANKVVDALSNLGHSVEMMKISPSKIKQIENIQTDVVFNLCEWSGKDYPLGVKVLEVLEKKGIPYTGSDSKSYEWCCNKVVMKQMFDRLGITTPKWAYINQGWAKSEIMERVKKLTLPIIIKPAYEHCSIGINDKSIIKSKKNIVKKIVSLLNTYKEPIIVEEFIDGREFTITVLKNHNLLVFPPAEEIFISKGDSKILSHKTKWINTDAAYTSKIVEDKKLSNTLTGMSKKIFTKMNCKGYIRIDMRMSNNKIYVLEVNINPSIWPEECYGLTVSTTAAGWDFNKLVNEITNAARLN